LIATAVVYLGLSGLDDRGSKKVSFEEAPPPVAPEGGANPGGEEGPSVREVYTQDGPGVVTIYVSSQEAGPGGGSGFVIDENGYVVTNQHVVEGADSVSVSFGGGAKEKAEVVGEDPSTDLALIKLNDVKDSLAPLTLGDSDSVGVGDPVIAIGNPLDVGISVTTGIVSGLGRGIKAPNGYTINGAVQTDAALSSGNSGGPLLDASGSVIGVNSQAASGGPEGVAQGVNFAVPINTVKSVAKQLIETGKVKHGYIGVSMFPLGVEDIAVYSGQSLEDLSKEYGLPGNGAIISKTAEGGPADEAGLKGGDYDQEEIAGIEVPLGDVITEVEGESVTASEDVIEVVNTLKPDDTVTLTVVTPGQEPREVEVKLGVQPPGQQQQQPRQQPQQ